MTANSENTRIEESILKEKKLLTAIFQADKKTMAEYMAPTGLGVDGEFGFAFQSDLINGIHQFTATTWAIEDPEVIFIDDESFLITYLLFQQGTFDGQTVPEKVYATSVWTKQSGKWQAVFHQEILPEAIN